MKKISIFVLLVLVLSLTLTGCISYEVQVPGAQGEDILTAEEALKAIEGEDTVLVDAQNSSGYGEGHLENAVNIARNDITVLGPFPNMLAPASKIEKALGENGIANDSRVIIYDNNNNMDAARLWWTMKVYGHEDVQVVSGGLNALKTAGAQITTAVPDVSVVEYKAGSKNAEMIATKEEVVEQVNNPSDDVVLLDVRTREEVNQGTIPGSVHVNYVENNNSDGTFKSIDEILEMYPEKGIDPDKTVIMYCKTSIRGAQTYIALHNAGYRDLKLYDGAWIEWSADSSLPVGMSEDAPEKPSFQDGS